jgi:hypothetical protein
MAGWRRIEAMARSVGLEGGVEARVADPLWLLARQWQVGELRGDDAAQPAGILARWRTLALTGYAAGGSRGALPGGRPMEAVVEASAAPHDGAAGLRAAAAGTRRLLRSLREQGLTAAITPLREAFALPPPRRLVASDASARAAARLIAARAIDVQGLAAASPARVQEALAAALSPADVARAGQAVAEWRGWWTRAGYAPSPDPPGAWDDERLEHSFAVSAADGSTQVRLVAGEHDGAHLDWHSFDVGEARVAAPERVRSTAVLPTPARYRGMPASRWWQFEDAAVDFGEVQAGPGDLARLLVAEFATSFAADWFVVPVRVPTGTLVEMLAVEVLDTFGGRTPVPSAAAADGARLAGGRPWRLFELTGDELTGQHPSPWLLLPPTTVGFLEGPVIEEVSFVRDEGANVVWGIEALVEGALGRAVDRSQAWRAAPASAAAPAGAGSDGVWRYRLEASAPPWWVPFLPQPVGPAAGAQVRLRRARLGTWALLDQTQVGAQGSLLDPTRPRWLAEEQVPKDGVRVQVRWCFARWSDGSVHVWRQRQRGPGRGERSSGLRWDLLEGAPAGPERPG